MTDWRDIDLRPAPAGWRVWGVSTSSDSAWSMPLVGWMVQEEAHYEADRDEPSPGVLVSAADRMRRIVPVAYVDAPAYLCVVDEVMTEYWLTLGPGQPDPTAEEIAAWVTYHRELEERGRKMAAEKEALSAGTGAGP